MTQEARSAALKCLNCGYGESSHDKLGRCIDRDATFVPIQHEGGRPPNHRCDKCGKPMERWAEPCERESAAHRRESPGSAFQKFLRGKQRELREADEFMRTRFPVVLDERVPKGMALLGFDKDGKLVVATNLDKAKP